MDEIEVITPDAIAIEVKSNGKKKNQIVYNNGKAKIVLHFRKRYNEDETLSRLDQEILGLTAELARKNAIAIAEIETEIDLHTNAIALLESKQDSLLSSPQTDKLKSDYDKHREENSELVPGLSVYLNQVKLNQSSVD
ncbi:hypothetical protein [Microseira sp. BLCC-F43]|jgi:hypothetical protein|uniref:hypothetical protein n=1 Tax=Microseira sp. BLCC-F43 TaxID=3153602 RepID=UPI0035B8AC55